MLPTKMFAGLAAASLMTVSTAALAAPAAPAAPAASAAKLSLASTARTGARTGAKNRQAAGAGLIFGGLIVAGVAGILIGDQVSDDNDSDSN